MSVDDKLTIGVLLKHLRQKLIEARKDKNEKLLVELGHAFDLIEEAALEAKDAKLAAIAEEMQSSVRDTFMGAEWKSSIPSDDEIEEASR